MINSEPILNVGIIERSKKISGRFRGCFDTRQVKQVSGLFSAENRNNHINVTLDDEIINFDTGHVLFKGNESTTFVINDVVIGRKFHWERKENQEFCGNLILYPDSEGTVTVINQVPLEKYLCSVISSEMSAKSPDDLLKAHAITSRSWLVAMLEKKGDTRQETSTEKQIDGVQEITRWYDREEHRLFDVCNDDHCQRYHGMTRIASEGVRKSIGETRGIFLVSEDGICDTRFSKCCGGITELYKNTWEDREVCYLSSITDSKNSNYSINSETEVYKWILSKPDAYCNTSDVDILHTILPDFDRETADFYRWTVSYKRNKLERLLYRNSGFDFGELRAIKPLERGPSGRITRLKISGTKRTVIVGKELEIRRWLAPSHLYSSAFIISTSDDDRGLPDIFTFHGAGWGHGVGLCQIGAAVMAIKGISYEEILQHYFRGVKIVKLY